MKINDCGLKRLKHITYWAREQCVVNVIIEDVKAVAKGDSFNEHITR